MGAGDGLGNGAERPEAAPFVLEAQFENANGDRLALVTTAQHIARLGEPDVAARGPTTAVGGSSPPFGLRPPA